MNPFLFMHFIFLGFWGGLVIVEMILELSLRKSLAQKHMMAQLHYRIDLYAEIPTLLGVLFSGLMLLDFEKMAVPLYATKVTLGLCPIIINGLCLIPVILRKKASDREDSEAMDKNTKLVFLAFFTGFTSAMLALGIGMNMLGIF